MVTSLTIPNPTKSLDPDEAWLAELELIGESEMDDTTFRYGVTLFPTLGDAVWSTSKSDLSMIYARPDDSNITLGSLHSDRAEHLGPEKLRLPYWVLNSDEIDVVMFGTTNKISDQSTLSGLLHELIAEAKHIYQGERSESQPITVNMPIPYRLSDINRLIDEAMGKLDKPASLAPYRWLKNRLESLSSDPRFSFMFGGITVHDNFAGILSQILRIPGNGRPISIVDLSSVPSEVINAVVSVILRLTFDFSL